VNVYPFIEAEKAQQGTLKRACELLEVSRAASYAHRPGTPSARQVADAALTEQIRQAHQLSKGRYGAHASTPRCAAPGTTTAVSAWPGCCAAPGCGAGRRAAGTRPPS
jgi:hypothetical protein